MFNLRETNKIIRNNKEMKVKYGDLRNNTAQVIFGYITTERQNDMILKG